MKIATKIYLNATVSICVVIAIAVFTSIFFSDFNKKEKQHGLMYSIQQSIAQLDILTYEYIFHHEDRMKIQWQLKYNFLGSLFKNSKMKQKYKELLLKIREDYLLLGEHFNKLVENHERKKVKELTGISQEMIGAAILLEDRLTANLMMISQAILQKTRHFANQISQDIKKSQQLAFHFIHLLTALMVITVIFISLWFARRISRQLKQLITGTQIIGTGQLDFKITMENQNEFGELATAINRMTKELRIITASRSELNKEIQAHQNTEEKLRKALITAENANRAKSDFLANMSHEIRTPLNTITGFSDLLSTMVEDEKQLNYLQGIKSAGKNLLTIINDILDLSKLEVGMMKINNRPINLKILVDEIVKIFKARIIEKKLDIIIDIDQQIPHTICIDEIRLRQILLNIVGNAVKFTEKGYIKISVKKEPLPPKKTIKLIIAVEDTGIGINDNEKELVFDRFYQGELQKNSTTGGTGLGLTISKKLLELMKGEIQLHSQPGKGSIFKIILNHVPILLRELKESHRNENISDYSNNQKTMDNLSHLAEMAQYPNLLNVFREKIIPKINRLTNALKMKDIKDLGIEFIELGNSNNFKPLKELGEAILKYSQYFDIVHITKIINEIIKNPIFL